MKTKLLGERGTVFSSLITAVLYHIFKYVTFYCLYLICVLLIIPSVSLYSVDLGNKLYVGYETIKPAVWFASVAVSFFLSPFVLAGFNYRFRVKMRKHFYRETFGMINYRDGVKWYFDNYGILDIVLTAVLSVVLAAVAAREPGLAAVVFIGIPLDAIGAYVSIRRGLTFWRIHSITCD